MEEPVLNFSGELFAFLHCHGEELKSLAVLGAAAFFAYKLATGWLLINLSVSLSAKLKAPRPTASGEKRDDLVVKVILRKGKIDAMRLLAAEVKVAPLPDGMPEYRPIKGTDRLPWKGSIGWTKIDRKRPYLNLSPNDSMQFSEHFKVTPGIIYRVDVVVIGDRNWWFAYRKGQWRSSVIVLDVLPEETTRQFESISVPHAPEPHSA